MSEDAVPEAGQRAPEAADGATPDARQLSRRTFIALLGASTASALHACKEPREPLVPYVRSPAAVIPSVPAWYATATSHLGYAIGLLVESREGRPIKIEGNPGHPASLGATDAIRQAFILDLYDPSRLTGFRREGKPLSWAGVLAGLSDIARAHVADRGAGLRFLVEPTTSPTIGVLQRRILDRFPRARFVAWSPLVDGSVEGTRIAFGRPLDVRIDLSRADVILSLECDFLGLEGEHIRHAREFASRREGGSMNRLYVAESAFTVTGGMADHRVRMRPSEVLGFARAVTASLGRRAGLSHLAPLGGAFNGVAPERVEAIAADLASKPRRALVIAGMRQGPEVHALAATLNEALENVGSTVSYREPALLQPEAGPVHLRRLVAEMRDGAVETLVITAWNPVYTAPADLDFATALRRAKRSIVLALREDATTRQAAWTLAAAHPLETWGDLRARDGTATIVQPLITPLHVSINEVELLSAFLDEAHRGAYAIVKEAWRSRVAQTSAAASSAIGRSGSEPAAPHPVDEFELRWRGWVASGIVPETATAPERVHVDRERVQAAIEAVPLIAREALEASFIPDYSVLDGRYAANAWLQEWPDPITKLTWDNAAMLSPATARQFHVTNGDYIELSLPGRSIVAPALVVPGHADGAVTLPLGYGQRVGPAVAIGTGFDAYVLRRSGAMWFTNGLRLAPTGSRATLAIRQGSFAMHGRPIALAMTEEELRHGTAVLDALRGPQPTILQPQNYADQPYAWGMVIDLSRCIGCSACVIACQAENNVPTVGKKQVLRSREMHWLRVDRYFEGPPEDPVSITQPLACVHCEMAPCEYVCPVNATVHSDEGLNEMIYNRCVGTRYCSNNCPYKVRRFNFFSYRADMPATLKMLMNPEVTVRARGVMEKCTYCIQRIQAARIAARLEGRMIGPDEVVPACAQACPAQAIIFGNLNAAAAQVVRARSSERTYFLLHDLGTRPRTAYLVRLRNPNPALS